MADDGGCLLADFGVAATARRAPSIVNLAHSAPAVMARTFVGTPCWLAPEVIAQGEGGYDTSVDMWSFGVTLLELAAGRPPAARLHPMRVLSQTVEGPPPTLEDAVGAARAAGFSRGFHDLLAACLQKDPSERPCASALLRHRFFQVRARAAASQQCLPLLHVSAPPAAAA